MRVSECPPTLCPAHPSLAGDLRKSKGIFSNRICPESHQLKLILSVQVNGRSLFESLVSYLFGDWNISTTKSTILTSQESDTIASQFELPHLPDMLFINNKVTFTHNNGATMEFLPLEALKLVNAHEDLVR